MLCAVDKVSICENLTAHGSVFYFRCVVRSRLRACFVSIPKICLVFFFRRCCFIGSQRNLTVKPSSVC